MFAGKAEIMACLNGSYFQSPPVKLFNVLVHILGLSLTLKDVALYL
jgi:hypothetical protein